MRIRDYVQEKQYDMGVSGTVTFNLDYTDPISHIDLMFEATNGASGNKNNPIERNISKIEIVDGGEVLWDLPGDVALALSSTLKGSLPHSYRTGALGDGTYQNIPILFGRFPYDPEYAFMAVAHKNPQLKITFDEATVRAAGVTGFLSDSFTVTIQVHLVEQGETPVAFFTCREIETFTSLASGDRRVEMPTDKLYRALIVRVYESGVDVRTDINHYKLSADGGKVTLFDVDAGQLVDTILDRFEPFLVPQYTVTDDGETHQTWVALDLETFIRSHISGHIATGSSSWPGQMTVGHEDHDGTSTDGQPVHFGTIGWLLHNTLVYPFGRVDVPGDWFDPTVFNKLDLFLTHGGADGEVNVCYQGIYRY